MMKMEIDYMLQKIKYGMVPVKDKNKKEPPPELSIPLATKADVSALKSAVDRHTNWVPDNIRGHEVLELSTEGITIPLGKVQVKSVIDEEQDIFMSDFDKFVEEVNKPKGKAKLPVTACITLEMDR